MDQFDRKYDLGKKVFITVGHPNSPIPMQNRVGIIVYEGESIIKHAKELRKKCAENPAFFGYAREQHRFKPSQLFYAVFDKIDSAIPIESSANFPGSDKLVNFKDLK